MFEITYKAKCKDCVFIQRTRKGLQTRHKCTGPGSPQEGQLIPKKGKICDSFTLGHNSFRTD